MIPNPIRRVLSSIQKHSVRALLMGGHACVFCGAAEFSRDTDLAFRFLELRTPELLLELARQHPALCRRLAPKRGLLVCVELSDTPGLERGLRDEEDFERQPDRLYWLPLRRELEALRHRAQAARQS